MDAGFVYMCLRFISCTWITLPVYHRDFWMADAWHSQLFCYEERICSIWWFCWTILLWTWMLMQIHFFHKHLNYIHLCTLLLVFHKLIYEIHLYRASSELECKNDVIIDLNPLSYCHYVIKRVNYQNAIHILPCEYHSNPVTYSIHQQFDNHALCDILCLLQ